MDEPGDIRLRVVHEPIESALPAFGAHPAEAAAVFLPGSRGRFRLDEKEMNAVSVGERPRERANRRVHAPFEDSRREVFRPSPAKIAAGSR